MDDKLDDPDAETHEVSATKFEDKKAEAKRESKRAMIEAYCREHKLTLQEFQSAYQAHTEKALADIGFMEFQALLEEMARQ
jgi:hypothetical protein